MTLKREIMSRAEGMVKSIDNPLTPFNKGEFAGPKFLAALKAGALMCQKRLLRAKALALTGRASQGLATTFLVLCTVLCALSTLQAGGLSTSFAELKIENISPGETYPLTGDVHRKFSVKNTSSMKIKLQVEVAIPGQDELKEGYEPFPASEFIVLERSIFELEPGESAETEVFFTIPKKKEFYGKKYQVYLWSHTIPEGGISVAVGLKSRFLLLTVERPKGFFRRLFGK